MNSQSHDDFWNFLLLLQNEFMLWIVLLHVKSLILESDVKPSHNSPFPDTHNPSVFFHDNSLQMYLLKITEIGWSVT